MSEEEADDKTNAKANWHFMMTANKNQRVTVLRFVGKLDVDKG